MHPLASALLGMAVVSVASLVLMRARARALRRADAALGAERARLQLALSYAGIAFITVDRAGTIKSFVGAPLAEDGHDRLAMLGGAAADELAPWPELAQAVQQALRGEHVVSRVPSRSFTLNVDAAPRFDDRGRVTEAIVTVRDVTAEVDEAERAARLARVRARMVAVMSYRLRSQLATVAGALELVEGGRPTPAGVDSWVRLASDATERLTTYVHHLVAYLELDAEEDLAPDRAFSLRETLTTVVEASQPTAEQRAPVLLLRYPPGVLESFVGDEYRLREVVQLLVDVAVRTNPQGQVLVNVQERSRDDGSATLTISVEDNGRGLTSRARERMFRGFESESAMWANRSGVSGLELPLARELVARLGGRLEVESSSGVGTSFHFDVALTRSPLRSTEELGPRVELAKRTVLLVDDGETERAVALALLEMSGVGVIQADGGEAALESLARDEVDAVVTELHMPAVDGYALLRRAREAGLAVPFVALTADGSSATRQAAQEAGFEALLAKPASAALLSAALRSALATQLADREALEAGIDLTTLAELSDASPEGQAAAVELVGALRESATALLNRLEDAERDGQPMGTTMQLLGAAARLLGARELEARLDDYDAALEERDLAATRRAHAALGQALARALDALEERDSAA
ncbi:MAG: response regulator [Dehalococcoidia bacterium]